MNKFTQKGFLAIELVIILVIIGLLGLVGYTAYTQLTSTEESSSLYQTDEKAVAEDVGEAPAVESTTDLDAATDSLDTEDLDSLDDLKSLEAELSEF